MTVSVEVSELLFMQKDRGDEQQNAVGVGCRCVDGGCSGV